MILFVDKITVDERYNAETKRAYKSVCVHIFPVIKDHGYKYELDSANSIQPTITFDGAIDHISLAEAFEEIARIIRNNFEEEK